MGACALLRILNIVILIPGFLLREAIHRARAVPVRQIVSLGVLQQQDMIGVRVGIVRRKIHHIGQCGILSQMLRGELRRQLFHGGQPQKRRASPSAQECRARRYRPALPLGRSRSAAGTPRTKAPPRAPAGNIFSWMGPLGSMVSNICFL